jgi:hypothetical protein
MKANHHPSHRAEIPSWLDSCYALESGKLIITAKVEIPQGVAKV